MPTLPTAEEQLYLELINRSRQDPAGEYDELVSNASRQRGANGDITNALQYFDTDMDLLREQLNGYDAVAPVAWSFALADSADTHTLLMIEHDRQSHNLPGEPGLGDRVIDAGYTGFQRVAENIFAYVENVLHGHAGFYIDWGAGPTGIQDPAGHRNTILSNVFTEVGLSQMEDGPGSSTGPYLTTQHFGNRWDYDPQLLGVVIDDADNDDFYDRGEGMGGVTVTAEGDAGTFTTTSWSSGGYQMVLPDGSYTLTFSGGGLDGVVTTTVTMAGANVKVDAEAGDAAPPPEPDPEPSEPGRSLSGEGRNESFTGGAGNDTVMARGGNDTVEAGAGHDTVDAGYGFDRVYGGTGNDTLGGANGWDTLEGGDGHDVLLGNAGNDEMTGGAGNDALQGGIGWDVMSGGAGNDTLLGRDGYDHAMGGDGNDSLEGNFGNDTLNGGAGDDTLDGGMGSDSLDGGAGHDSLAAGNGADTLLGGTGDDTLAGNAGMDRLNGGAGNDVLFGGTGADSFVFNAGGGRDTVLDFQAGTDRLVLNANLFEGTPDLSDVQGAVRRDADGDLRLDFGNGDSITLNGITQFSQIADDISFL
ncbi:CAP domain-containing protein [Cognatishimia sp. F0-27]|uniref:CAP domain-containing protein n=1 Tax=Cognatishimia sp. F0-27 TaxID=2816855 RepID=UPI001D0CA87B|nr:CAP domain-containing protein [Cognatishimia sp. F0-27]MCC1494750.1 hypothetical protein [Cognatishimia sp. F0-27]